MFNELYVFLVVMIIEYLSQVYYQFMVHVEKYYKPGMAIYKLVRRFHYYSRAHITSDAI